MLSRIYKILGIIISISTILGGLWALDSYIAKASDVKVLELRLDEKIMNDRADALQQRIWKLEDRFKDKDMPPEIKDEIRKLKLEYEMIMRKLDQSVNK